jgi:hypothetical protein
MKGKKGQKATSKDMINILAGSLMKASCKIPMDAEMHHP